MDGHTTTPDTTPPDVVLQVNNSGAWKTLAHGGLNDLDLFRTCVDGMLLPDRRPAREQAKFRLALQRPGHVDQPLQYREPGKAWRDA